MLTRIIELRVYRAIIAWDYVTQHMVTGCLPVRYPVTMKALWVASGAWYNSSRYCEAPPARGMPLNALYLVGNQGFYCWRRHRQLRHFSEAIGKERR